MDAEKSVKLLDDSQASLTLTMFADALEQAYQEKLAKLCRDGLSKGITVVFTAADTKGMASYLASAKQKIAFEMPADKYMEIFNGKTGMIGSNPGHGFANVRYGHYRHPK